MNNISKLNLELAMVFIVFFLLSLVGEVNLMIFVSL